MAFDLNMACALDLCNEHDGENESSDSPIDSSDGSDEDGENVVHVGDLKSPKLKLAEAKLVTPCGNNDDDEDVVHVESSNELSGKGKGLNSSNLHSAETKDGNSDGNGRWGFDCNREVVLEMEAKLQVGACFGSLDQALVFYCEYGRLKGFSVRRADQRYKGSTKEIRWKDFVCCCAGIPYAGVQNKVVRRFRKLVKRTQCKAKIRVHPIENGIWKNTLFFKDHNHPLLAPDQSHLLRSSRFLSEDRLGVLQSMNAVGIPVNLACGFVEAEAGGAGNVGYIRMDVYNKLWLAKKDKRVLDGDSIALLEFLNSKTYLTTIVQLTTIVAA